MGARGTTQKGAVPAHHDVVPVQANPVLVARDLAARDLVARDLVARVVRALVARDLAARGIRVQVARGLAVPADAPPVVVGVVDRMAAHVAGGRLEARAMAGRVGGTTARVDLEVGTGAHPRSQTARA